ncbi:hypothetical protein B1812_19475 [Methylocystis bryophila]|uniref:Uncharacterized protein n=1 Tax=Methylocystis bryophila TaxID=655015 RepID=A0A1W6MZ89_9HYPH|nr:hypothetical protein B1812_19475 [Methylocystis bryophila]
MKAPRNYAALSESLTRVLQKRRSAKPTELNAAHVSPAHQLENHASLRRRPGAMSSVRKGLSSKSKT